MIKINELYIRVNTADETFEFRNTFDSGLNVITSYTNTKGKSTIGESILFCLGFEEILGYKNERAVKPVLRSLIEKNGEERIVVQSDIYLEIENSKGDVITLQRSPKHNDRNVKLVTVYNNSLSDVVNKSCSFTDYYVHDVGAARNIRGFHFFLEKFVGFELPIVATYDGTTVPLYIQTIASCYYIEQKKGWMNILATMPTYYRIKDSKKRVLEYVLGLSVLENEREYQIAKAKLKKTETEWDVVCRNIKSRVRKKKGFSIENIKEKPYVMSKNENPILYFREEDTKIAITEIINNIEEELDKLNNVPEPNIENRSDALNREMNELSHLLEDFSLKLTDAQSELSLEQDQLNSIEARIESIIKDLDENKDLRKLIKLGSLENANITRSKCPTCGQKIDDTLFDQSDDLKVMTIDESIMHLENEKTMLEFTKSAQLDLVRSKGELVEKLEERVRDISTRIRIVKSDLISNNKALSQSHVQQIVDLKVEKESLNELDIDVTTLWEQLRSIGYEWAINKERLEELPSNFISNGDRKIINKLNEEFKRLLTRFKFESTTISNITIEDYNYLPSVQGFDLHADSSASDTIRIIWSYIIALQKVSIKYGNNLGFMVLDEPAQQNADISSAKELMVELLELSRIQQVFILYKMEKNDGLLDDLPKTSYKRIHAEKQLISLVSRDEE